MPSLMECVSSTAIVKVVVYASTGPVSNASKIAIVLHETLVTPATTHTVASTALALVLNASVVPPVTWALGAVPLDVQATWIARSPMLWGVTLKPDNVII